MFVLAAPVHGQRNPPTVPTVLATAVMGGYGMFGALPHFVVGRAPADWPSALLPGAPWKTVGGVEHGPMRTVVLEAPRTRDAVGDFVALLTRAGLREMSPFDTKGGFEGALWRPPRTYCNDSSLVTFAPLDSTAATRSLVVNVIRGPSARACADEPMIRDMEPLDIPALRAPIGVSAHRRGGSTGTNYMEQVVEIDTTVGVARALDHYAQQLAAAGWTVVGRPLVDGGAGLQRLSVRDRKGTEWQGVLLAITMGAQRHVALRMAKPGDEFGWSP
jgi:hypothetical protein